MDVDTNHYSVPWRLIGAEVAVQVGGGQVCIHHAGTEVACHDRRLGRRERAVDGRTCTGACRAGGRRTPLTRLGPPLPGIVPSSIELLRPLAEYERVAGGGW